MALFDAPLISALITASLGSAAAFVASTLYLTTRRKRRRSIREEEKRLRVLFRQMPPKRWNSFLQHLHYVTSPVERRMLIDMAELEIAVSERQNRDKASASDSEDPLESATRRIDLLESQLADLQSRFPDPKDLPKITDGNHVRIVMQNERIDRDLQLLTQRTLTRGDVMVTLLGLLTAIAAIVTLSTWAIGQIIGQSS